jgi:parvulin-like peptidyl-prolyl isomerase
MDTALGGAVMKRFSFGWISGTVLILMGLLLTGFEAEQVVARVNGEKVVLADLLLRVRSMPSQQSHESGQHQQTEKLVDQALEKIIANRLILQEAKTNGIPDVTEEDFSKTFTPSHMTLPNLSDRSFQEDWVVGVLRERLEEKLIATVPVKEKEIKKKFEEIRYSVQPETAVVRWIVVDSEREAQGVMGQIRAGADFGHLAQKVSIEEVSARGGGIVGAVRPDKIPLELSQIIFASTSKPGLVSHPIQVTNPVPFYGPAGWYIIKIDRIIRQGEASLDTWRPVAEHMVRKEKATKLLDEKLAKRRKEAKIWTEKDLPALVEGFQPQENDK